MRRWQLLAVLALLSAAAPAAAQDPPRGADYWDSLTTAAREMSNALDAFQDVFLVDSGPIDGRGLFKQSEQIRMALIYFRQQVGRRVSRDQIYAAYDKVNRQTNGLLGIIKGLEQWDSGLALAARKLRTADHDLQFAVSAGDGRPATVSQVVYRQTLALLARVEYLDRTARWVYSERPALADWSAGLKNLKREVIALQQLQQKKAAVADLRTQLLKVGKALDQIVTRYQDAGDDQYLLQTAVSRTDRGYARLAGLFGIKDRRAALSDNLFN